MLLMGGDAFAGYNAIATKKTLEEVRGIAWINVVIRKSSEERIAKHQVVHGRIHRHAPFMYLRLSNRAPSSRGTRYPKTTKSVTKTRVKATYFVTVNVFFMANPNYFDALFKAIKH